MLQKEDLDLKIEMQKLINLWFDKRQKTAIVLHKKIHKELTFLSFSLFHRMGYWVSFVD